MAEPMDKERQEVIRKQAENYKEACRGFGKAATELWEAQIDMAIDMGDEELVRRAISKPGGDVGLWDDNTNCGTSCNGGGTAHW